MMPRRAKRPLRPQRAPAPLPTSCEMPTPVTLISDATGSLGDHVLRAVFTQFSPHAFSLARVNFVNSDDALHACLERLKQTTGLVVHATIFERYKRQIERVCRQRKLPVFDLTGPIMEFLTASSGRKPQVNYARLHELGSEYFRRMESIEFAIEHDDGGSLRTLHQADIVLTGVSRTTKTPTSMVLAMQGYRSANVPLVQGLEPPRELLALDPKRVVCLSLNPSQLVSIRERRLTQQLKYGETYADERAIQAELVWARKLSQTQGWPVIDVTGHAVEETAARVLEWLGDQER